MFFKILSVTRHPHEGVWLEYSGTFLYHLHLNGHRVQLMVPPFPSIRASYYIAYSYTPTQKIPLLGYKPMIRSTLGKLHPQRKLP